MLYSHIELCTINNGHLSQFVEVSRSVLQGSPIGAFMFLLAGQLLHDIIKQNDQIEGLSIGEVELLLAQFADDTTLFLKYDKITLEEVARSLDVVYINTGLIVHYNKTNIYRVGSLANTDAKIYTSKPFHWTNDPISMLSVKIPTIPDVKVTIDLNFSPTKEKIENVLKLWSLRVPTLMGRVLIVNALIASLFVDKMQVFPDITLSLIEEFECKIRSFVWNNKKPKISQNLSSCDKQRGSLRLVDLKARQQSLKIQWVARICESPIWSVIFYELIKYPVRENLWRMNLSNKHVS